ncbi:hypothetical protein QD712_28925 [Streptomyces acidiscabies]|uniref:hypothetical protein n=1 Tax=Streptomyces acidiscabies TaxID=42234 RepID=UPI0030CBC937
METFVTVAVIVGVLVLAVLLIRLLDAQHGDRTSAFHYGRSGLPLPGPASPASRKRAAGRRRLHLRRPHQGVPTGGAR